ncbi:hypothetical protein [Agrococcus sp. TSP3-2-1]|uniref:hypothetical protein n=1 Tax=Agrococcus sp. TSP3-2-1 TaxID=2804583 RepID=UPI003CF4564F
MPTVHPRGDRRIVRCAQVALNAGYRVHFVWLGDAQSSSGGLVAETVLPSPRSAFERVALVSRVAGQASLLPAAAWHIHDFYFLETAKRWRRRTGIPVLYDVHEYYGEYYARKLPLPSGLRRRLVRLLDDYQVRAARRLGAANVVSAEMAAPFTAAGIPVSIAPNYPMYAQFGGLPSQPFESRRWNVLNIGTLTPEYGTEMLIRLAARSEQRSLPFVFQVVERYPAPRFEEEFRKLCESYGSPNNLRLLATRPTHEMPELLATAGFGLSLLMENGQNDIAIPSKLYEHAMAGLVNVVTKRGAQHDFSERHAVTVSGNPGDEDRILDEMLILAEAPRETHSKLLQKSDAAKQAFTWERGAEPGLANVLRGLTADR